MSSYRDTSIPATRRVVDLVGHHHGLPDADWCLESADQTSLNGPRWNREARRRHMSARRRVIKLREIPEAQYPVILEINGGSNFVILTEKQSEETYSVQFPDSRESDVSAERLEDFYDGSCVFLKPVRSARKENRADQLQKPGRSFRNLLRSARLSRGAIGFNLVVLLLTCLAIYSNDQALGSLMHRSLTLPMLASAIAGAALAGVIGLRQEFFRHRVCAGWIDLAFVPVLFAAAIAFAGWAIFPMIGFASLLVVGLLSSKRLGTVQSRLQRHWKAVVLSGFLIGATTLSCSYLMSGLNANMMIGALGLGSYAVYLVAHGGSCWQSIRLALFH